MKKEILNVISALMGVTMLFTACNGGCNNKKQNFEEVYVPDMVVSSDKYDTTHVYEAQLSDKDLVKDGKSEYAIVYPENNQNEWVDLAVEELQNFFYQATGIMLPVMKDSEAKNAGRNKVLSLDSTVYVTEENKEQAGVLNDSGFIIRTEGDAVIILGNGNYGTLYGVYEFLHIQFGYKIYAIDEIVIETGVDNKKLYDFNVTDIALPIRAKRTTIRYLRHAFACRARRGYGYPLAVKSGIIISTFCLIRFTVRHIPTGTIPTKRI